MAALSSKVDRKTRNACPTSDANNYKLRRVVQNNSNKIAGRKKKNASTTNTGIRGPQAKQQTNEQTQQSTTNQLAAQRAYDVLQEHTPSESELRVDPLRLISGLGKRAIPRVVLSLRNAAVPDASGTVLPPPSISHRNRPPAWAERSA